MKLKLVEFYQQKNGDMDYKCFDDKNEIVFMNHTGDQVAPSYSDAKKIVQSVNCHYELVDVAQMVLDDHNSKRSILPEEFVSSLKELLKRAKGE
jgi:hypothetical protein